MKFIATVAVAVLLAAAVSFVVAEPTNAPGECWIANNNQKLASSETDATFATWGPYTVFKNYGQPARTFFFDTTYPLTAPSPKEQCDENLGVSTTFEWTESVDEGNAPWTLVVTNTEHGASVTYTGGVEVSDFPAVVSIGHCDCLEDGFCIGLVDVGDEVGDVEAAVFQPLTDGTCGSRINKDDGIGELENGFTITDNIWMGCACFGPPPPAEVMGDPHFIVGGNVYDWKQVGVYNHLEFDTHAVELTVEEFPGCDGQVSGEFIRSLAVTNSNTAYTAACDGIYDARNKTLVAAVALRVETPCAGFDLVLTNGYFNLYRVAVRCNLEGGVFKTLLQHDKRNPDGWYEVKDGAFTLIHGKAPKVVPLVKDPVVISIDF